MGVAVVGVTAVGVAAVGGAGTVGTDVGGLPWSRLGLSLTLPSPRLEGDGPTLHPGGGGV